MMRILASVYFNFFCVAPPCLSGCNPVAVRTNSLTFTPHAAAMPCNFALSSSVTVTKIRVMRRFYLAHDAPSIVYFDVRSVADEI
jgi:hypothetical protein